jgi:hypothetical protein
MTVSRVFWFAGSDCTPPSAPAGKQAARSRDGTKRTPCPARRHRTRPLRSTAPVTGCHPPTCRRETFCNSLWDKRHRPTAILGCRPGSFTDRGYTATPITERAGGGARHRLRPGRPRPHMRRHTEQLSSPGRRRRHADALVAAPSSGSARVSLFLAPQRIADDRLILETGSSLRVRCDRSARGAAGSWPGWRRQQNPQHGASTSRQS